MSKIAFPVIGAKEALVPDGHGGHARAYVPVVIAVEDLPKFDPPGFKGWFVTRKGDRTPTIMCPGDTIRVEFIEESPVSVPSASPITLRA